jgi:very-short-patch-repair endonuclease
MTLPEVLLWQAIRAKRLKGLTFRRQRPIGPYILDFYCWSARLAVEVDGLVHESERQSVHDTRRGEWLAGKNVRVLRIPASDILDSERMEGVLASIACVAAPSTASRSPSPATLRSAVEEPD